ncbi:MAG: UDP-3-O-(3-hydroxymyristoyl)glucosamine N-acyltransferase [Deltaproteobacteria bacterium]|nr:UDP-3-O-(3-hydroxymyristoyl)glucosamine N-acyltransferase [Deltaproteobacteria bacterium]
MEHQKRKVSTIAVHIQAEIVGNPDFEIVAPAPLELADADHISFLDASKPKNLLEKTQAQVIIAEKVLSLPKTYLIVENPKLAFAKVLELWQRPLHTKPGIDPRAWVEEGCKISESVTIYPFVTVRGGSRIGERVVLHPGVYIGENTLIGDDCILYPNVCVYPETILGKRVLVHSGVVLGSDGFGYVWNGKYHYKVPQIGNLVIEDDVEVGANTCVDRGTVKETKIGRGSKIDNLVQIGHNDQIGPLCIICGQVGIAGSVTLGAGSILGGQVGVRDNVKLGEGTQVGAQSGVSKDSKPHEKLFGSPAEPLREYLRRRTTVRRGA